MTDPTAGGRGRVAALAASATAVLGALVLVWALVAQQPAPPEPAGPAGSAVQDDPVATSTPQQESRRAQPSPSPADEREPASSPAAPTTPDPATVEPLPPSTPVQVDIPDIEVSSPLHPLGLADDGTLEVPSGERYDEAAWYDGSPTPGEPGPTVVEGHVTSSGSTPSVFFELGALEPGDTVDVTREDGTVVTFEVYATDRFPKDAFPKVAVYGNTAGPELRLITCGGDYDPDARAHVDNIVVFARMVSHT